MENERQNEAKRVSKLKQHVIWFLGWKHWSHSLDGICICELYLQIGQSV